MKIVLFEGEDGWRYRVVAANGEKLAVSEAFSSKSAAIRGTIDFINALPRIPVEDESEKS